MIWPISYNDVLDAERRIRPYLVPTPLRNYPLLDAALGLHGPLDLRVTIAQALQMGDECHNRNAAATSLMARRLASALRVHRIIQAVELSVLILLAAIADAVAGNLTATRVLTVAALVVGVLMTVAHLLAIVASRRLR